MAGEIYGFAIKVEDNAVKSIDAIDSSLVKLEDHANKAQSGFKDVFKGFLGAEAVIKSFELIKSGLSSVLKTGSDFEQTGIAYEVMLGSAKAGREMTSELKKWADITPFDNKTAFDAGRLLLNYGVAAKDIIPYMNMLGDASGGVKERFDRMTYAFGQIAAAGKLQGQDLRQLVDAGFNPLQEMSKMTGKSMGQLKDDMAAGLITFDKVVGAFKHATSEGGRFSGMMIKQSQTVGGLWSTLESYGQSVSIGLFQRMAPALRGIEIESIKVAKSLSDWISPQQSEVLKDQKNEMNNLFKALEDGNVPTNIRKQLIEELNSKFKDYLPNLISERDTLQQIADKQKAANDEMNKSITLAANKEKLERIRKQASEKTDKAVKSLLDYEDLIQNPDKWRIVTHGEYTEEGANKIFGSSAKANPKLNELIRIATKETNQNMRRWANEALGKYEDYLKYTNEQREMSAYEAYYLKQHKGLDVSAFGATPPPGMGTGEDVSGITAGAAGGLGSVKQININMDKWIQVNTGSMDSSDLQKTNESGLEQFVREIHNLMAGAGSM